MNGSSPQQQNLNQLERGMLELLVPDTTRVKNATKFVTQCLKQPQSVSVLLKIIQCNNSAALRQMSAVFIRKKVNTYWKQMNENLRQQAKTLLLARLRQDPARSVRRAIAGTVAAVGKFQVSNGGKCNEILQHTITACQSQNAIDREISMLLFYFLASEVGDSLSDQFNQLRELFVRMLQDKESAVRIMALKASAQVLEHVSATEHGVTFSGVIPVMLNAVKHAVASGEDGAAVMAFDLMTTMADADALPLLNPYITPIMQLILETSSRDDCSTETRNSALMVFASLVKTRPRSMQKYPHIRQAVQLLVKLVCIGELEEAGERAAKTAAAIAAGIQVSGSPSSGTAQFCLDQVALHLTNDVVFQPTVSAAMQCVKSASCHVRAGGLIALSIIAEGTIRMTREHLHSLLPVVIAAAKDRVSSVRRASCVCLGQWIEHMGAMGMVEHHAIVLPPVLNLIGDSDASVQEAAMYVWECFADHMDPEETRPYFKPLMNQMGCMLRSGQLQHQVMAFTAIGACAVASKVEFRPHFNQTIAVVKQALSSVTDKSKKLLVARSLECCGQIAVAVGANVFRPHLQDCMRFAVMATKQDDTVLHDHAIAFFSNLCVCFGKEFASFAQQLLPYLFQTVAVMDILEGTTEQDAELGGAGFAGFEDDGENDESKLKLSVSTANADKKVSAIRCLGAIADYIPAVYATNPTVSQEAVKQLREVMDYWHIEIRCAAIEFAGKLFIAIGGGRPPKESEKKLTFRTGLQELMDDSIREMFETLEHDSETDAVLATCEALQDLTNSYGVAFLEPYMRNLLNLIDLLLKEKAQCQCHEYDEDDEDASYFVEQNESVLNSTFDLLGAIAKSCGPSFEPHFRPLASLMMQYLHTSRPVSIRCSCLGCFAEVLDAIKVAANNGSYADVLLPHIIQGLSAEARGPGQLIDVRNIRRNSSYCVSVLVGACGNHNRILSHFPTILKCLRPLFVVKHKDDLVVRDNAASALSRMVLISPNALPLVEVLPVLLSSLPLRMDEQENKIVYRSIFMLWKQQHPALLKNIPSLLKVLCQALGGVGVTLTPTLQRDLVGLTKSITDKAKNQLSTYAKSLNDSERSVLQKVIQLR